MSNTEAMTTAMTAGSAPDAGALAVAERQAQALAAQKFDASDDLQVARMVVKSGVFGDITDVAKAMAKIQAGKEMGFTAVQSLAGIHFIQGRLSMGANLIASAIKRSRQRKDICAYDYRVKALGDDLCELEFFEVLQTTRRTTYPDGRVEEVPTVERVSLGVSRFDQKDARRQSTKNIDKFPRNMLFARALTNGARWFTPDVFGGAPVYTPDEIEDGIPDQPGQRPPRRETAVVSLPAVDVRDVIEGEVVAKVAGPCLGPTESLDAIRPAAPQADPRAQVETSPQPRRKARA